MYRLGAFILAAIITAGCSGSGSTIIAVDEQFGHRYEGTAPDGRETHVIEPADSAQSYVVHPAVFDSVHVRPQVPDAPEDVELGVELLIKGSFPDSCTRLHAVRQTRSGNILNLSLDMRRPRAALCASVVRPYRFYYTLDGTFPPGNYTLKVNDAVRTFTIREPESK